MILTAFRGKDFHEDFAFKSESGEPVVPPVGDYRLVLEHGGFTKEYARLNRSHAGVVWALTKDEVESLPYTSFFFTLNLNGQEIARGVLRVQ